MNATLPLSAATCDFDRLRPWDSAHQPLECRAVIEETANVRTFVFQSATPAWFRYRPGQFVILEIPHPDGVLHRSYTIASTPSRPFSIEITVKAQPESIATRWMFDNLRPGMSLRAQGPMGQFFLSDPPAGPLLFISAGSGITPVMSMLRWCADCALDIDIAFVHCARTPADIIFRDELLTLARRLQNLSLIFVTASGDGPLITCGRLDGAILDATVPDAAERDVWCCGPEAFMAAMQDALVDRGLPALRFRQERFAAPVAAAAEPSADGQQPVRFTQSGVEILASPDRTILDIANECGVRIATACGMGICGTCKVHCTGAVDMHHQGGIFDDEIAEGFILACCSRPRGSVEIGA